MWSVTAPVLTPLLYQRENSASSNKKKIKTSDRPWERGIIYQITEIKVTII